MSKFNINDKVRVVGVPTYAAEYDVGIVVGQLANDTVLVDWTTADAKMREKEDELELVPHRGLGRRSRQ